MARERPSTYLNTNTNTQPRGFRWRIHCGVEVTVSSINKQHSLSSLPCVHYCVVVRLVTTRLGSSYLIAHVLNYPPSPRLAFVSVRTIKRHHHHPPPVFRAAHSLVLGTAVINDDDAF